MKLKSLLESLDFQRVTGTLDKEAKALVYHSDKAVKNSVFFAIEGQLKDGRDYIGEAVSKGADTVVIQKDAEIENTIKPEVTVIKVEDVRKALAHMSARFYDNPSEKMLVIGVTGTKGKTSTVFMIRQILEDAGIKTGIIGTVFVGYEGNLQNASATTPQSYEIQKAMKEMYDEGCKAVVMEVSSQGLMQSRAEDINFDIGIFTNITPDHIGAGEHENFEEYLFWKSTLFKKCHRAIINIDDPHWKDVIKGADLEQTVFFGKSEEADFRYRDVKLWSEKGLLGIEYLLESKSPCGDGSTRKILLDIPGRFNVQNSLAAIAVTKSLGIPWSVIEESLKKVRIPGRVERIPTSGDFTVLVDYAHNGISLKSLMESLREYEPERIILVFGCGGNRDRNRRFEMGKAAMETADFIIVTSDNPRRENPLSIIDDITGVMKFQEKAILAIPDRRKAIERAVKEARCGDIVVIAGKGHETYQIIGDDIRHFDDKEVILSLGE